MERFYLENISKYRSLVDGLDPFPKPRISNGKPGPNMTVCARIRPLSENEGFPSSIFPRANQKNVVEIHDLYHHPKGVPILKSSDYQVDRIFNPSSTTSQIYEELIADLVPYAWNGGVGTLFAYGQTGSGKTFTISQVESLTASTLMNGTLDGERSIYMTIIDLAGNAAFDLLNSRAPISLREDASGATQMVGAQEHQVFNVDDMRDVVERATAFRRTAPTLKNPASSRSHAICRIRIRNAVDSSDGLLYLVDLAGSEAARDVAVHGADRMRETKQINISLSVLKNCIRAKAEVDTARTLFGEKLGQKVPHIPFRQSALTRVLKHVFDPSSTRACRTIVIACVNPSLADVGPTKNTLRFAELLRVLVPATDEVDAERKSAMHWTSVELKEWITENAGNPPILSNTIAPRESGAQLFKLSSKELEYRCQKCPGVKLEQARAFRSILWQMYISP
ncbi:P-loop containing nucleoside triphosphate hydrolase protein [Clohesyomyces aquaticus]|uniref:p-loop containing nucleoside triphosphate hydrolase protein n=1 Tax=Clohesyomyces aquaticus TaxID=1231657 RepID=A0A1Y2A3H2_9PLEO|nr:P-loop containing nucleoside triphosphate hydrolase protein [Clohesyomyces aquaticus]